VADTTPAVADIAARRSNIWWLLSRLVANIRAGGSDKWGRAPMPPQTELSDADTRALARWILALAR